jgi:anti-sigma B factor antagonist
MLEICEAHGDIDLATAPALSRALRSSIEATSGDRVVVDCADVQFMDSSGFHVLLDASRYAATLGRVLEVRDASPSCARVLRLCDWDNELTLYARPVPLDGPEITENVHEETAYEEVPS